MGGGGGGGLSSIMLCVANVHITVLYNSYMCKSWTWLGGWDYGYFNENWPKRFSH